MPGLDDHRGRHERRQDVTAQRPFESDPGARTNRHDRGRSRAAGAATELGGPGDGGARGQPGPRRGSRAPGAELAAHDPRPHHRGGGRGETMRSTCSGPSRPATAAVSGPFTPAAPWTLWFSCRYWRSWPPPPCSRRSSHALVSRAVDIVVYQELSEEDGTRRVTEVIELDRPGVSFAGAASSTGSDSLSAGMRQRGRGCFRTSPRSGFSDSLPQSGLSVGVGAARCGVDGPRARENGHRGVQVGAGGAADPGRSLASTLGPAFTHGGEGRACGPWLCSGFH